MGWIALISVAFITAATIVICQVIEYKRITRSSFTADDCVKLFRKALREEIEKNKKHFQ